MLLQRQEYRWQAMGLPRRSEELLAIPPLARKYPSRSVVAMQYETTTEILNSQYSSQGREACALSLSKLDLPGGVEVGLAASV